MTDAPLRRFPIISPTAERFAIGLMAGTSLDGIDAALVKIVGAGDAIQVVTLANHHAPYTPDERAGLLRLMREGNLADLCAWDAYLGQRFAQTALELIQRAQPPHVDFVGSHGQTIWHAPNATLFGTSVPNTLQIGQPDVIAARVGVPVVADFRTRDMAYGGQGAPLVPIVDWLLLRHATEHRIVLNLGGMANITVLPAGGAPETIQAFDTGPANALIDLAVQQGTHGARHYDADGALASVGTVHASLLEWLMAHPYLQQPPPKSTGREVFGEALLDAIQVMFGDMPLPDLVATLTEFTAASVADALRRLVLPRYPATRVMVSGGGVHNRSLMRRLQTYLPDLAVESSGQYGVDPDSKEATAFAVLADRFLQGLPATYPNTTGVSQPTVAGKLALPAD
ncbi:MAG: anhydro-N-acetylmuramic acid kinase [Fimbriimonadales bacterium]|nr:anhydro-N-acetylmuramic acid kinase [Fimbriimonadales bacterium]